MKTEAYEDFLIRCIRKARDFAGEDEIIIYINPSDEKKRSALEDAAHVSLTVSAEDFIGGIARGYPKPQCADLQFLQALLC